MCSGSKNTFRTFLFTASKQPGILPILPLVLIGKIHPILSYVTFCLEKIPCLGRQYTHIGTHHPIFRICTLSCTSEQGEAPKRNLKLNWEKIVITVILESQASFGRTTAKPEFITKNHQASLKVNYK